MKIKEIYLKSTVFIELQPIVMSIMRMNSNNRNYELGFLILGTEIDDVNVEGSVKVSDQSVAHGLVNVAV